MNRPIIIIVIGYIIGIIWGLYLNISIVFLYIILVIIYIIINIQYKKRKFKILSIKRYFRYIKIIFKFKVIIIIILVSLISNIAIKYQNKKYEEAYNQEKEIQKIGIIVSNKEERDYSNRYIVKIDKQKYYINVDKNKNLEYGDKIKIVGEYEEPQSARNYKGFDYKEYLKTLKIYGIIYCKETELIENSQGNKLMFISNKIFSKIKENIEKTFNRNTQGIILGIMLGDTKNISEKTREGFSKSNISHVLAVSGLHISYIIYLTTISSEKFLGKRKSKILTIIVLIFYMFITGFSVSIIRAGIMGILNCFSFIVYRKSNTLNNIAISALITLLINPFSIISLSFLLSYGGTIGIVLFNTTVEKALKNIKIRNRKWKYLFLRFQRKCENIIKTISVTISAQIIIAPILAIKFNDIGLSFILTNLLLSFIIGIIVMGGFIQIVLSFISISFGTILAKIIQILIYLLILISKIDFGNLKIVTPEIYQIFLYYLLVFILIQNYKIFHNKFLNLTQIRIKNTIFLIKYKLKPYFNKSICLILIIFIIFNLRQIPQELKIYFIDVGQGDSTLIVTPYNKKILVDGGGSENYDIGENTLLPYLLDRKIKSLDYIIISHFDQDHIRWYIYCFRRNKSSECDIRKTIRRFRKL